jgi:hypothetical protein
VKIYRTTDGNVYRIHDGVSIDPIIQHCIENKIKLLTEDGQLVELKKKKENERTA